MLLASRAASQWRRRRVHNVAPCDFIFGRLRAAQSHVVTRCRRYRHRVENPRERATPVEISNSELPSAVVTRRMTGMGKLERTIMGKLDRKVAIVTGAARGL